MRRRIWVNWPCICKLSFCIPLSIIYLKKLNYSTPLQNNIWDIFQAWLVLYPNDLFVGIWKCTLALVIWAIWWERNKRIFRKEVSSLEKVFHIIEKLISEVTNAISNACPWAWLSWVTSRCSIKVEFDKARHRGLPLHYRSICRRLQLWRSANSKWYENWFPFSNDTSIPRSDNWIKSTSINTCISNLWDQFFNDLEHIL